jgi:hypothetical protein
MSLHFQLTEFLKLYVSPLQHDVLAPVAFTFRENLK